MCYNVEEMVVCTRKCFPHILKIEAFVHLLQKRQPTEFFSVYGYKILREDVNMNQKRLQQVLENMKKRVWSRSLSPKPNLSTI